MINNVHLCICASVFIYVCMSVGMCIYTYGYILVCFFFDLFIHLSHLPFFYIFFVTWGTAIKISYFCLFCVIPAIIDAIRIFLQ